MTARVAAMFGVMLVAAGAAAAQEGEVWEPATTTAMAITGRVTFAPDRITFGNRASLPLEPAGEIPNFRAEGQRVTATLYRVTEPANPVLLRGSRLCAQGRPVRAIVVWQPPPIGAAPPGPSRAMAAFSSQATPREAEEAGSCGTFHYEVPQPRGPR
jgi:hypothetical protein